MDSFYTTCNQIDTDLGLNLYHDRYYSQPVKTLKPLFHRHLKISP